MNNKRHSFKLHCIGVVSGTRETETYVTKKCFYCSYHFGNYKDFSSSGKELGVNTKIDISFYIIISHLGILLNRSEFSVKQDNNAYHVG